MRHLKTKAHVRFQVAIQADDFVTWRWSDLIFHKLISIWIELIEIIQTIQTFKEIQGYFAISLIMLLVCTNSTDTFVNKLMCDVTVTYALDYWNIKISAICKSTFKSIEVDYFDIGCVVLNNNKTD